MLMSKAFVLKENFLYERYKGVGEKDIQSYILGLRKSPQTMKFTS